MPEVRISFDGEPMVLEGPVTIAELLRRLGLSPEILSVARNGVVVSRSLYEETWLDDGDRLEGVIQVGGG